MTTEGLFESVTNNRLPVVYATPPKVANLNSVIKASTEQTNAAGDSLTILSSSSVIVPVAPLNSVEQANLPAPKKMKKDVKETLEQLRCDEIRKSIEVLEERKKKELLEQKFLETQNNNSNLSNST